MSRAGGSQSTFTNRSHAKYLTFRLGREEFAIPVLKVREIMRMQDVTSVPQTPDYVRGVINLRGKVIPIVDLRVKFRLEAVSDTDQNCIVVVDVENDGVSILMGTVVDAVCEVITFGQDDINEPPDFGEGISLPYLTGVARSGDRVKALIDIDKLLMVSELTALEVAAA